MEGIISSFRGGVHTQKGNHMIVLVDGVSTREEAEKLVGKTVTWTTPKGNTITGKVASAHGNKGAVRAIFERGMPGQSIPSKVSIA